MSRQVHRKAGIQEWGDDNDQEFTIYPKDLDIVWGNDSRYWKVPEDNGPAEVKQVVWLEVSAVARVEKNKKYRIEFEVEVKEKGFGWNNAEVLVMAKAGRRGKYMCKQVKLSTDGSERTIPNDGPEGALEIEMNSEDLLHFGLYEVWSGKWKGGLLVKKAKITNLSGPKNNITNVSHPENKITIVSGPQNKITNLSGPEKKITNLSGPGNKITNLSGPQNKITNLSNPENKITNVSGPQNKITNLSSPENKITNVSSPENKIIKISIPEEDPDYCGPVVNGRGHNEFINYKCNVQVISFTVAKNKGL